MKKPLLLAIFTFLVTIASSAQTNFTGTVFDENNVPLPGASVVIKGSSTGVATDFDGNFQIQLANGDEVLVVSYIGYVSTELSTAGKSSATITLQPDSQKLDEVVVTALGIKREKKSLGYASQELGTEEVTQAREPNLLNSISGKVAGLQVTNSPTGLGAPQEFPFAGGMLP